MSGHARVDGNGEDECSRAAIASEDGADGAGISRQDSDGETAGWIARGAASVADEVLLGEWIARVVDRDQEALAALYDALANHVYALALRMTRQPTIAEEVVQDTFWQVWRQAPRFDSGRGSARAWIMTMARSRALDALRRVETKECELEQETLDRLEGSEKETPLDLLSAMQEGDLLHTALESLDAVPRQLVALAFLKGYTHDEIAGETGLPLGTVKSHIRRALMSLRDALAPYAATRL